MFRIPPWMEWLLHEFLHSLGHEGRVMLALSTTEQEPACFNCMTWEKKEENSDHPEVLAFDYIGRPTQTNLFSAMLILQGLVSMFYPQETKIIWSEQDIFACIYIMPLLKFWFTNFFTFVYYLPKLWNKKKIQRHWISGFTGINKEQVGSCAKILKNTHYAGWDQIQQLVICLNGPPQ